MFIFLHSFFSLLFQVVSSSRLRFFLPPVQMYPPACLVSFHFSYYTFQFPMAVGFCYIISEFFIDTVSIMQHCHHVFLDFFNRSSFQFLNIFIMANLKLFSVRFDFSLSQAVSIACFFLPGV